MIGGMKPSSSERRPCTGSPCIGSAATIFTRSPSSSLKRRAWPISVPPVPRPGDERVDLAVELLEDLRRRPVVVGARVGRVPVLVGHVVRGVGGGHLERHRDGAVGALVAGAVDDLGAVHLQQLRALGRDVVRHHDLELVALARADHRQRDAGVARRRLEDRLARLDQAAGLGVLDHRLGDAVLDRAGRVHRLELGPDAHARLGREAPQLDERRVADRLDDVRVAAATGPALERRETHTSRNIASRELHAPGRARGWPDEHRSSAPGLSRGLDRAATSRRIVDAYHDDFVLHYFGDEPAARARTPASEAALTDASARRAPAARASAREVSDRPRVVEYDVRRARAQRQRAREGARSRLVRRRASSGSPLRDEITPRPLSQRRCPYGELSTPRSTLAPASGGGTAVKAWWHRRAWRLHGPQSRSAWSSVADRPRSAETPRSRGRSSQRSSFLATDAGSRAVRLHTSDR